MHSYPLFDRASRAANVAFARERGFGTLAVNHDTGPLVSHVPFVMDAGGTMAEMHLARNNGLLTVIEGGAPAVLSVSGPDGYVSPDWYEVDDQVPTWNYVAVTLRGRASLRPADELRAQIDGLSAQFERRIVGKTPWTSEKMSAGVVERMMRAIVLVRLDIEAVEGTWKLGQNKPDAARLAAADRIEAGSGTELSVLAELMRTAK
ncbi:MAG TPA: negative transcriptional regulator [Maritimibacter sp.]|nr:negative transcriptional regulator [Maritimibacter sp.]